jgi:hypothetical protein
MGVAAMRYLLFTFLVLGIVTTATASLSNKSAPKISIPSDPGTPDGREGGETDADAFVIPSLPFTDMGNTSDNIDDYDEVCPYTGSTSPDVVYLYTPTIDIPIDITLCTSGYDTKVYVYENGITPGDFVACNDDADCAQAYRSKLEWVELSAGNSYYIVVDGFGGDMGDYELLIRQAEPECHLHCSYDDVEEGEPELVDGYVDMYNGGCNSDPAIFQPLEFTALCGNSGWYLVGPGLDTYRDTDWFTIIAGIDGFITTACNSEEPTYMYILLPTNCDEADVVYEAFCDCNYPESIEFAHPSGEEVWLWIGPASETSPELDTYEFLYLLYIHGYAVPTATNKSSWGTIKNQFK